jgi:hypothetical protein
MKTVVPFLLSILLFCSCSPYQYLTISNSTLPVNSNNNYTADSDSLEITYSFDGYNALLQLGIENKSSSPVIMDWKKSAIITNGITIPLYNSAAVFTAKASFDTAYNTHQIQSSVINGQVFVPESNDFIPPHAGIIKKTVKSITGPFNIVFAPDEKISKENVYQQKTKLNLKKFNTQNSPGKIRVYLTYSINYGANKNIDTEFFVSEILSVAKNPDEMIDLFGKTQSSIFTHQ